MIDIVIPSIPAPSPVFLSVVILIFNWVGFGGLAFVFHKHVDHIGDIAAIFFIAIAVLFTIAQISNPGGGMQLLNITVGR
jgi:hypothetical protein